MYEKQYIRGGVSRAWRACALTFLALSVHSGLCAAVVDPAQDAAVQEQVRQQQRDEALRKQQQSSPDVRLPIAGMQAAKDLLPKSETPCFSIQRLELTGQDAERFQWALGAADRGAQQQDDSVAGRCLGAEGLNIAITRVQNAIIERGYVTTRVMAAPQNLAGGTLTLSVVPGRVHAIRLAPGVSVSRATLWNALPLKAGDILNLRDIEQGLENLERVPTVQADVQIVPAEGFDAKPGESDLVIQWVQSKVYRITASVDDAGSKTTGRYQGGLTLSYDHWWTLNDLFYVNFGHDLGGGDAGNRGTHSQALHYSVPFGYWQLAWNTSDSAYRQAVAGANQTYLYSGESSSSDLRLSRMIYRDAINKSSMYIGGWVRSSSNCVDDTEVQVQRRQMAGWQIGVSHKVLLPQATVDANVAYRQGTGAMGSIPAPEEAFGEGTSRPRLVTADLQLARPFKVGDATWRYTAALRGQWNRTPLIPQDRFAIGGRYTVRGFDGELTLSAERGWVWRNDLAVGLGHSGQELYVGLDHGQVAGNATASLVGNKLTGAALGMRGAYQGLSYDVFWSWPLYMPEAFQTVSSSGGFSLTWSY
ncbi:MAG: ShlB/FhaC/HecB family hemolysin secretion/activation protein [Aquabacterium sp.]|uniref:ShlB/FhaC/HecB family hemolysin secretion/activation protein n=1 Tax=Aquabacterium sp. TaxID=1872578 RepID=UPI00121838DF|nr:MAG: ShlB/FhaC/HecB family hemolysin secretion/activation protein [Aquabacterium sp.]